MIYTDIYIYVCVLRICILEEGWKYLISPSAQTGHVIYGENCAKKMSRKLYRSEGHFPISSSCVTVRSITFVKKIQYRGRQESNAHKKERKGVHTYRTTYAVLCSPFCLCSSLVGDGTNYRYFAEEFSKTSLYWSSLCDLMRDNDGSTQTVRLGTPPSIITLLLYSTGSSGATVGERGAKGGAMSAAPHSGQKIKPIQWYASRHPQISNARYGITILF